MGSNPVQRHRLRTICRRGNGSLASSTFDPREYRGLLFEEMLKVLVKHRMAERGVEPLVNDAIARYEKGELSTLDQHVLLAALELHPEAGGEPASRFLHNQLETLDPADLWKMLRMARCYVKRSEQDVASEIVSLVRGQRQLLA